MSKKVVKKSVRNNIVSTIKMNDGSISSGTLNTNMDAVSLPKRRILKPIRESLREFTNGKNDETSVIDDSENSTVEEMPRPKPKIIRRKSLSTVSTNTSERPKKAAKAKTKAKPASKEEMAKTREAFINYLNNHRSARGEPHTHTTKVPTGTYYISEEEYSRFFILYNNAVSKGNVFTVTEKPSEFGPLRVDVDLKAREEVGLQRQYTPNTVKKIIGYYQDIIKRSVKPEDFQDKMLWCIWLDKPPRYDTDHGTVIVKDGFHLHFPFFISTPWFQDNHAREEVMRKMISDGVWDGMKYIDKPTKYIDTNMGRKPWLMYGSSKDPSLKPFLYKAGYDHNLKGIPLTKFFEEEMVGRKCSVKYYLPLFLSIRGQEEPTKLTLGVERKLLEEQSIRKKTVVRKPRRTADVLADVTFIKQGELMDMLAPERSDNYDTWMDVGWTLYCIGQGGEEALELWKDFSKKSPKYWEGVCENQWDKMNVGGKTLGSLLYMVKNDNPDAYNEWRSTQIEYWIKKSLFEKRPTEWDVSQVVYAMYKYIFVCADSRNNIWYEFGPHKWNLLDDSIALKKLLVTEVIEIYREYRTNLSNEKTDESTKDDNDEKIKKVSAIITALKTVSFQEKLIKQCKIQFHDDKFEKKKNRNKNIFVCENGVLDDEMGIFREGRPDDYSTISCGIEFPLNYTHTTPEVCMVKEMYEKIFVNPRLRKVFFDFMAENLVGGNRHKVFLMHSGAGHNGKSITFNFLAAAFGEYFVPVPREVLLKGNTVSSNAPRPELLRAQFARIISVPELTTEDTINLGMLKFISGGDKMPLRGMYDRKMEDSEQHYTGNYQCNDPPKIPGHDDAAWDRILVLPYESMFVLPRNLHKFPVPSDPKKQFEMKRFYADDSLESKFPELAPGLLWILWDVRRQNKGKMIEIPEEVKLATNKYRAMHDVYTRFIDTRIRPAGKDDPEDLFLKASVLRNEFDFWYKNNYDSNNKKKLPITTIIHDFSKKLGKAEKKGKGEGWFGYKLVYEDDDEDEVGDVFNTEETKEPNPSKIDLPKKRIVKKK